MSSSSSSSTGRTPKPAEAARQAWNISPRVLWWAIAAAAQAGVLPVRAAAAACGQRAPLTVFLPLACRLGSVLTGESLTGRTLTGKYVIVSVLVKPLAWTRRRKRRSIRRRKRRRKMRTPPTRWAPAAAAQAGVLPVRAAAAAAGAAAAATCGQQAPLTVAFATGLQERFDKEAAVGHLRDLDHNEPKPKPAAAADPHDGHKKQQHRQAQQQAWPPWHKKVNNSMLANRVCYMRGAQGGWRGRLCRGARPLLRRTALGGVGGCGGSSSSPAAPPAPRRPRAGGALWLGAAARRGGI